MTLAKECRKELENNILPFWKKLRDDENGGYYGYMDFDLKLDKKAPKGVILNSRILWFFSNCYLVIGGEDNLDHARHAFEFLKNYITWDETRLHVAKFSFKENKNDHQSL